MTELDMTDQDVALGPIDYLALEFPEARMSGEGLAAIIDLVDRGLIRILDLRAVKREVDGTFTEIEIADFDSDGTLDLAVLTCRRADPGEGIVMATRERGGDDD